MADPTIKDVLDAIGTLDLKLTARIDAVDEKLSAKIDAVDANLGARIDAVDANLGAKIDAVDANLGARINAVDAKVDAHHLESAAHRLETAAHRLETAKAFADLDRELANHSDPVHRKLEEEMAELRKLVMAKKAGRRSAVRRPRQA